MSDARGELGRRAEQAVADYLESAGATVLARNVRVGRLEIDLVVREGPVVAVVEVRARGPGSWQGPLASVDAQKRARVRSAGERLWRERLTKDRSLERMRFDVVGVTIDEAGAASIEWIKAAF
jgi:putative endonuclease